MAGVSKTIAAVAVATAFRVLYWRRQHCKQISNGRLELFKKIITLLTVTVLFLFTFFNLILDAPRIVQYLKTNSSHKHSKKCSVITTFALSKYWHFFEKTSFFLENLALSEYFHFLKNLAITNYFCFLEKGWAFLKIFALSECLVFWKTLRLLSKLSASLTKPVELIKLFFCNMLGTSWKIKRFSNNDNAYSKISVLFANILNLHKIKNKK